MLQHSLAMSRGARPPVDDVHYAEEEVQIPAPTAESQGSCSASLGFHVP